MCVATVDALCCRKKLIAVFVADISLVSCSYVLVVFNLSLPYDMYQKDQFSQLPSLVWLPKIECGQGDTIYSALIMPCLVLLEHYNTWCHSQPTSCSHFTSQDISVPIEAMGECELCSNSYTFNFSLVYL